MQSLIPAIGTRNQSTNQACVSITNHLDDFFMHLALSGVCCGQSLVPRNQAIAIPTFTQPLWISSCRIVCLCCPLAWPSRSVLVSLSQGVWYEIASTANLRKTTEAGVSCATSRFAVTNKPRTLRYPWARQGRSPDCSFRALGFGVSSIMILNLGLHGTGLALFAASCESPPSSASLSFSCSPLPIPSPSYSPSSLAPSPPTGSPTVVWCQWVWLAWQPPPLSSTTPTASLAASPPSAPPSPPSTPPPLPPWQLSSASHALPCPRSPSPRPSRPPPVPAWQLSPPKSGTSRSRRAACTDSWRSCSSRRGTRASWTTRAT